MKINFVYALIIVALSSTLFAFALKNNRGYQTERVTIETDGYVIIKICGLASPEYELFDGGFDRD